MGDVERGGAAGAETSDIGAAAAPGRERRMTAGRKRDAVLRVLRGEPLEIVARELAVTAADLSGWRDAFLEAGAASLKSRARDDRDETIDRLRTKVGELTMDTELLHAKIERLEAGVAAPLLRRGGRSDEHRHLDLHAPPLRCRPGLPGVGRRPGGRLPPPPRGGRAAGAAAQAGAAGADARRRAGRGDPAGAHRQPLSWRGLPQGLGAAAPCGPADLEGAGAPPDARERPVGRDPQRAAPAARATTTARSSRRPSTRCGEPT